MQRTQGQRLYTMQLSTQQYRLRNLTRIEGINLCSDGMQNGCKLYYTLHHSKNSEAFYTSEILPQHMQQKWADINCPEMLKSNKNCICVKVWIRMGANELESAANQGHQTENCYSSMSSEKNTSTSSIRLHPTDDKLLFSWGVYFSGLTMLQKKADIEFEKNALIFQLNGMDFTSSAYISSGNEREQSASPYQRGTHTESSTISSSPESFLINSPRMSRSSSPKNPEVRLIQINFRPGEVRRSYDLGKLLRIQDAQRQRIRTNRESDEIIGEIKQLSVYCITPEQLKRQGRTTSSSYSSSKHNQQYQQYHSMGRKLSKLLAEDDQIEPAALLRAQKLLNELESLRFRNGLLITEQKTLKDRITDLNNKLSTTTADRLQLKQNLEQQVSNLEKEESLIEEQYQEHTNLLQRRQCIVQSLEQRRSTLIAELQEIYPIKRNEHGLYTICDIPCPSLGTVAHSANNAAMEQISPLALRASLGYIAHLVKMISIIIDQPLRSPLTIDETWIHYYKPKFNRTSTS